MKHACEKWTPTGWVFDPKAARRNWERAQVDAQGVVRWLSNGSVPFPDMLFDFRTIGLIDEATESRSVAVRVAEEAAFLASYRKAQEGRQESPEELYELRAAFGPGAEVVNVLTGKKTKL